MPGELSFPWSTPSQPGDFVRASQSAKVLPDGRQRLRFRERDDFTGATAGYHFKQLLVNDAVVWEADVAGGTNAWREVTVDVTAAAQGRTNLTLALLSVRQERRQQLRRPLAGQGLAGGRAAARRRPRPAAGSGRSHSAGPLRPGLATELKPPEHRFHVPFIVMTAGDAVRVQAAPRRPGQPRAHRRVAQVLFAGLAGGQVRRRGHLLPRQAAPQPGFRPRPRLVRPIRPGALGCNWCASVPRKPFCGGAALSRQAMLIPRTIMLARARQSMR